MDRRHTRGLFPCVSDRRTIVAMTPTTKAGRALSVALLVVGLDEESKIAAIEREAAAQERVRIARLFEPINAALEERHSNPEWITNLGRAVRKVYDAILAEPGEQVNEVKEDWKESLRKLDKAQVDAEGYQP